MKAEKFKNELVNSNDYPSGKLEKKFIYYYCPDCGATYSESVVIDVRYTSDKVESSTNTWYKCDCGSDAFEVDNFLIDVIKKLNKLDFPTEFCCEGHSFEVPAYIIFNHKVDLNKIKLPYLWKKRQSKMVVSSSDNDMEFIYRWELYPELSDNPDTVRKIYNNDFDRYKNTYLNSLYVWIDELITSVLEDDKFRGTTHYKKYMGGYDKPNKVTSSEEELKQLMKDKNYDWKAIREELNKKAEEEELRARFATSTSTSTKEHDQSLLVHNEVGVTTYECNDSITTIRKDD